MSKVLVENHREHDIVITVAVPGENQTITIPAGKMHELANKFVPGSAEVDEELLAHGRKNKNVEAYFDARYLSLPKGYTSPEVKSPAAPVKTDGKTPAESSGAPSKPLSKMNLTELTDLALEKGLEVEDGETKAQIAAKIEALDVK